jgi:cobalt-precorrin-7 (C5)-methyltransferase
MANLITIAGCGPGSPEYLTPAVCKAVERAEVVCASSSIHRLFARTNAKRIVVGADTGGALDELAKHRQRRAVVAVSGDPGISSFGRLVVQRFGRGACRVIPAVSAFQAAFAALGMDWTGAYVVSAHARTPAVDRALLTKFDRIAVLAGGAVDRRIYSRKRPALPDLGMRKPDA